MLNVSAGVLDLMEYTLNAFACGTEPTVKLSRVLNVLILAFLRDHCVVGLFVLPTLPVFADKALVPHNRQTAHLTQPVSAA